MFFDNVLGRDTLAYYSSLYYYVIHAQRYCYIFYFSRLTLSLYSNNALLFKVFCPRDAASDGGKEEAG